MSRARTIGVVTITLLVGGRTGAESLAHVADSIAAHACSVSTPSVAQVWSRALADIRAGQRPLALDLLDSLRTSGAALPESFDLDFATISAYCLLPGLADPISGAPRGRVGPGIRLLDAAARLAPPRAVEWRVTSAGGEPPAFFFVGRYTVRVPCRLTMHLAGSRDPLRLRTMIADTLREYVVTRLVHDPDRPPVAVDIGVTIDRSESARLPRDEYLQRMIAGQFDGVSLGEDLPAGRAVSVRCVRTYPGMPDDYRAYVVLDIPRRRPHADRAVSRETAPGLSTRYVIVMRAREDVKQEAEELLAFVVARFAAQL